MPNNETEPHNNDKADQCLQSIDREQNISRRTVIKKLAVGSAALAGCSILPEKWTAPIIEFGSLPAHATTSGEFKEALEKIIADASETVEEAEDTVTADTSETAEEALDTAVAGTGMFSLVFYQTVMACDSCGIWFDSARLVIEHSNGTFTSSQSSPMLIKKTRGPEYFSADLSSIPSSATIQKATLTMSLNTHEGIANSDNKSVIEVYDYSSGSKGDYVRSITAAGDIKGSGYDKSNPHVPIDFTSYAKQAHGE